MDERIEELLDRFDFEAVKEVMAALNWKWGMGADAHFPTYGEMRRLAREQLQGALTHGLCASWGFEAREVDGVLTLALVAVSEEIEIEELEETIKVQD